jgi:hypothetical protein
MISITSPTNGATVGHSFSVSGTCDSAHTVYVDISGGEQVRATQHPGGTWSADVYCQPSGSQTITAKCGNPLQSSAPVTVTVS